MHQFITGHWAGSEYSVRGERFDRRLLLSPTGSYRLSFQHQGEAESVTIGTWTHGPDADLLHLRANGRPAEDEDEDEDEETWRIHYVTGCEAANTILVLRRAIFASRNLPILFYRVHPADDPVWRRSPKVRNQE